MMQTYLLMLYVTLEQEEAIRKLYTASGWYFQTTKSDKDNEATKETTNKTTKAKYSQPEHSTAVRNRRKPWNQKMRSYKSCRRKPTKENINSSKVTTRTRFSDRYVNKDSDNDISSEDIMPLVKHDSESVVDQTKDKKNANNPSSEVEENAYEDVMHEETESADYKHQSIHIKDNLDIQSIDTYDTNSNNDKNMSVACSEKSVDKIETETGYTGKISDQNVPNKNTKASEFLNEDNNAECERDKTNTDSSFSSDTTIVETTDVADRTSLKVFEELKASENRDGQFVCRFCSKCFVMEGPFKNHLEKHLKSAFDCPDCGKKFTNIRSLNSHRYNRSKQETFSCEQCQFTASTACLLRIHKKTHTPQTLFKCHLCHKVIKSKSYFNVHLKTAHNVDDGKYLCPFCGQKLKRPKLFAKHLEDHRNEGNHADYQCKICHKVFKMKRHLRSHQLVHQERKHLCDFCGKGFRTRTKLQLHHRTHNNVKPFACTLCDYRSVQGGNLRLHMKVHEKEEVRRKEAEEKANMSAKVVDIVNKIKEKMKSDTGFRNKKVENTSQGLSETTLHSMSQDSSDSTLDSVSQSSSDDTSHSATQIPTETIRHMASQGQTEVTLHSEAIIHSLPRDPSMIQSHSVNLGQTEFTPHSASQKLTEVSSHCLPGGPPMVISHSFSQGPSMTNLPSLTQGTSEIISNSMYSPYSSEDLPSYMEYLNETDSNSSLSTSENSLSNPAIDMNAVEQCGTMDQSFSEMLYEAGKGFSAAFAASGMDTSTMNATFLGNTPYIYDNSGYYPSPHNQNISTTANCGTYPGTYNSDPSLYQTNQVSWLSNTLSDPTSLNNQTNMSDFIQQASTADQYYTQNAKELTPLTNQVSGANL